MKSFVSLIFIAFLSAGHAQSLSRAYFNFDCSYNYFGLGLTTHFSDRYVFSGILSHNGVPTGAKYAHGYIAGVFTDYERVKNSYANVSLLGGVSFNSSARTMFVFQAGPSIVLATECTNIQIHSSVSDELEYATYTETSKTVLGIIGRADFTFRIHSRTALNIGCVANMTFLRPIIVSPVVGLRFGMLSREDAW